MAKASVLHCGVAATSCYEVAGRGGGESGEASVPRFAGVDESLALVRVETVTALDLRL